LLLDEKAWDFPEQIKWVNGEGGVSGEGYGRSGEEWGEWGGRGEWEGSQCMEIEGEAMGGVTVVRYSNKIIDC
jgi:hypothetical protein